MPGHTNVGIWADEGDEFEFQGTAALAEERPIVRLGGEIVCSIYAARGDALRLMDSLIAAAKAAREEIKPTEPKDIATAIIALADRYIANAGHKDWEDLLLVIDHTCPRCGAETDEQRQCEACNEAAFQAQEDEAGNRAYDEATDRRLSVVQS